MADETLLSDLCSICNAQKFKYRCPGCSARTCSLPCYKRHQQWAQCSGKRDPTAFVKKSQLATPAGIDHDFNFLTGIERKLERVEQEVSQRGIDGTVEGEATGNVYFSKSKKAGLHPKDLERAGVTLIQAPKGLSRQRENTSHRNKRKNIIWTVEWIFPDKTRSVREVPETQPLVQVYQYLFNPRREKKRKLDVGDQNQTSAQTTTGPETDANGDVKRQRALASKEIEGRCPEDTVSLAMSRDEEIVPEASPAKPDDDTPDIPAAEITTNSGDPNATEPSASTTASLEQGPSSQLSQTQQPQQPQRQETATDSDSPSLYFFLHRPLSRHPNPVLIPLDPSLSLSTLLQGRTILEFPTIYVFSTASPPAGEFMLEEEYLTKDAGEEKELVKVLGAVKGQVGVGDGGVDDGSGMPGLTGEEEVDEKKILDVLKRDLGGTI
ncbi:uncharacterized protein EI97DRAFT_402100 [Westerdykella ornata]|uniref:Box C/D snoRNA protein 1 n=1 Tax=Westerdykella ornata TaxID=318751 RepID=A0A6A6JEX8_WESOR|nr:uncharacterized protein EI97DRAFT_402100 [Westerdykella ornata]KAF2274538.1 hypothetical protein EI97DRAFT_402100 [Westerdykella ornata]